MGAASPKPVAQLVVLGAAWAIMLGILVFRVTLGAAAEGECAVVHWSPMVALPWAIGAVVPLVVYLALTALRREPAAPVTVGDGPYRQSVVERAPRGRSRLPLYVCLALVPLGVTWGVLRSRTTVCPYSVPTGCRATTERIVVRGVGEFDQALASELAKHFHDCYGLPVELGPPIPAPRSAWNADRGQWEAEALMEQLPSCSPNDPLCRSSTLTIGVTSGDIFTSRENWRYAFGTRDSERGVAIFSTARMGKGGAAKYTARMIAFEYCGFPRNDDPKSVRTNLLMGPDDLDAVDEAVW